MTQPLDNKARIMLNNPAAAMASNQTKTANGPVTIEEIKVFNDDGIHVGTICNGDISLPRS